MERYKVRFLSPDRQSLPILVPLSKTKTVGDLKRLVPLRLQRLGCGPGDAPLRLRLGSESGPILDDDDALEDVVPNPGEETIFAMVAGDSSPATAAEQNAEARPSAAVEDNMDLTGGDASRFAVRVITPSLARRHKTPAAIPTTPGMFSAKTTLGQLRDQVGKHVNLPATARIVAIESDNECNCSLIRAIHAETQVKVGNYIREDGSRPNCLVISGDSNIQPLYLTAEDRQAFPNGITQDFLTRFETYPDVPRLLGKYCALVCPANITSQSLPLIAVCSQQRHPDDSAGGPTKDATQAEPVWPTMQPQVYAVDLHTSEGPIMTANVDVTLGELCLTVTDGVLDLFATARPAPATSTKEIGKDSIYLEAEHWKLVSAQSERGMAMFLASLRVFAHLAVQSDDDQRNQDSILHVLHTLTRFPPAVRAMYILLGGNVPSPAECACLIQASYEVVQDMVAKSPLAGHSSKTLEGSRLFFGMILAQAKALRLKTGDGLMLPYMTSMKTVHPFSAETMEPISFPVATSAGLMERGFFAALKADLIAFTDLALSEGVVEFDLDERTKRAILFAGGQASSTTVFDSDVLYSNYRYTDDGDEEKVLLVEDLADFVKHAAVALTIKMSSVSPSGLKSAPNPTLTLDRDGHLAVYIGRQPCGQPGKDFLIYRPTNGGETAIDPAIVSQLLEPILTQRVADGTSIFDGLGEGVQRRSEKPGEILMICVDCSQSMNDSVGFNDIDADESANSIDVDEEAIDAALLEDIKENEIHFGTLVDAKEALASHASFEDIIHTIKRFDSSRQKTLATQFIQHLIDEKMNELRHWMAKADGLSGVHWHAHSRGDRQTAAQTAVQEHRTTIAQLCKFQSHLAEFLVYRTCCLSTQNGGVYGVYGWSYGDLIPASLRSGDSEEVELVSVDLGLTVPPELCCSMTQEIFDNPATTVDGQIYEYSAIHKWFRIMATSPLTGLPLRDTSTVQNRAKHLAVHEWVEGHDILTVPLTPRREGLRSAISRRHHGSSAAGAQQATISLAFDSRLGTFQRVCPTTLTLRQLYEVVFRHLKGRYPGFALLYDGRTIPASAELITSIGLEDGRHIAVYLPETPLHPQQGASSVSRSRLCLVKVYHESKEKPCLSYWVRTDTRDTIGSIPFKLWRETTRGLWSPSIGPMQVWRSLCDAGDGRLHGQTISPWETLSSYTNPMYAKGSLNDEPIIQKTTEHDQKSEMDVDQDMYGELGAHPLVLKLYLHAGRSRKRRGRSRELDTTRLSVLKQMFDQFVNRILAYGYPIHLGLITFNSSARVAQPLTHVVENFRATVQALSGNGDTALWDSIELARDQVNEYARTFPDAKKRILCISDGKDTSSTNSASVWQRLRGDGITLDSFTLGHDDHAALHAVSHLTYGFKFHPTSLSQAMAICEMEPVLARDERDEATLVRQRVAANVAAPRFPRQRWDLDSQEAMFRRVLGSARPETVTADVFPARKPHAALLDAFVELKAVSRRDLAGGGGGGGDGTAAGAASRLRTYRIMTEMQALAAAPHPHMDVYVSEKNMAFWKVVVAGPPDSVYAGGTFVLYLDMEEGYPAFAPRARFLTPLYHPNVNRHGRICHSIFDRNWTTDTSNAMVLATVYGLLLTPDYSDPVNIVVTLDYHHDQVAFADMARDYIQRHATQTREEWRSEILGE